jgi:hypothetical protein
MKTITRNVSMNTGKIMIGFSLVLLSVAMMVSPSGAAGPGDSREVGSGVTIPAAEISGPADMHLGQTAMFISDIPRSNATYPYER